MSDAAAEELIRYDSPVQLLSRVAWEPTTIGGVEIDAGDRVVAYLGAGNRDPRDQRAAPH